MTGGIKDKTLSVTRRSVHDGGYQGQNFVSDLVNCP